jgi:MFS family permease
MRSRYWQIVLAVFCLGWVFMYADRTVLSPVLPLIGAEWHLTGAQLGLISSIFFLLYAAMQLPTGFLADRLGRKLLLVPGYLLFGLTTALSALAPGYATFLLLGALSGMGEGTYYPTQFSLSGEVIPRRVRGLGAAIINSGQALGISLGLVASGYIAYTLHGGWRASFAVLGVATMAAGLLIWLLIRERPPLRAGDAGEAAPVAGAPAGWRALLTRDLVLTYAVGFCSLYGFFAILTWLPYYLQVARHTPASFAGVISSLVPWASLPGALVLSYLSDRLGQRKRIALVIMPLAALAMLFIPLSQGTAELYAALIVYGLVGKLALDPLLVAYVADRTPRASYSSAYALLNFTGMLSSILAPYITGMLRDVSGSLDSGFYLAAVLLLAGTLCMALTRGETRQRAEVERATSQPVASEG